MLDNGTSLDANAQRMCRTGVGFHNGGVGAGEDEEGEGSNWSRGASGVGVEFHGSYDGTFFEHATQLDYCSATGFGRTVEWCSAEKALKLHGGHDPARRGKNLSTTPDGPIPNLFV